MQLIPFFMCSIFCRGTYFGWEEELISSDCFITFVWHSSSVSFRQWNIRRFGDDQPVQGWGVVSSGRYIVRDRIEKSGDAARLDHTTTGKMINSKTFFNKTKSKIENKNLNVPNPQFAVCAILSLGTKQIKWKQIDLSQFDPYPAFAQMGLGFTSVGCGHWDQSANEIGGNKFEFRSANSEPRTNYSYCTTAPNDTCWWSE